MTTQDDIDSERTRIKNALASEDAPEVLPICCTWADNIPELRSVSIDPHGRLWVHVFDRVNNIYELRQVKVTAP